MRIDDKRRRNFKRDFPSRERLRSTLVYRQSEDMYESGLFWGDYPRAARATPGERAGCFTKSGARVITLSGGERPYKCYERDLVWIYHHEHLPPHGVYGDPDPHLADIRYIFPCEPDDMEWIKVRVEELALYKNLSIMGLQIPKSEYARHKAMADWLMDWPNSKGRSFDEYREPEVSFL